MSAPDVLAAGLMSGPPTRRADAMVRRIGAEPLRARPWEARDTSRVIAAVAAFVAAVLGTLAFRALLVAAPSLLVLTFTAAAVAALAAAIAVGQAPGKYAQQVTEPLALLVVAGGTWDHVRDAIASAPDRGAIDAACARQMREVAAHRAGQTKQAGDARAAGADGGGADGGVWAFEVGGQTLIHPRHGDGPWWTAASADVAGQLATAAKVRGLDVHRVAAIDLPDVTDRVALGDGDLALVIVDGAAAQPPGWLARQVDSDRCATWFVAADTDRG